MLLLLPLDKRLDWKKPPLVTIFLILINCFIFYALQSGDDEIHQKATQFYFKSNLAEMEIPIYKKYLLANKEYAKINKFNALDEIFTDNSSYTYLHTYLVNFIDVDFHYYQALQNNTIPNLSRTKTLALKKKRQTYLDKYQDSIIYNYSLRPASPTFSGLFGHMFLHAGTGHLFGNMLFLFIIGFVVEAILGGWIYLVAYLLTGLGSAALDILIQSNSFNFHLGASGAISGVMGMYAALFGLRKIQFFYNILFWVDRIKAPAIIMLFAWLVNEFLQMVFIDSNVNYLAHVGGLLSGALIAYILSHSKKQINTEYMDAPLKEEQYQQYMSNALQFLGELEITKAKSNFKKARSIKSNSIEALEHLYQISQQEANTNDYQKYAIQLMQYFISHAQYGQMFTIYEHYLKKLNAAPLLSDHEYLKLIKYLIKIKRYQQAEKLIIPMFQKNNSYQQYPEIFLLLGKQHLINGDKKSAIIFMQLIINYFPQCREVKTASRLL